LSGLNNQTAIPISVGNSFAEIIGVHALNFISIG